MIKAITLICGILCLMSAFVCRIASSISVFYHRRSMAWYQIDENKRNICIKKSKFYEELSDRIFGWTKAFAVCFYLAAIFYFI